MFASILILNVNHIFELFGAFLDQTGLFWGPGLDSKNVLGSTHMYYWIHKTSVSKLFEIFLRIHRRTDGRPTDGKTDRQTKLPLKTTSRRLKKLW